MGTAPTPGPRPGGTAAERLVGLLEALPVAVIALDSAFRLTYVNAVAERLLGVPAYALLGREVWERLPGHAAAPRIEQELRAAQADGRPRSFDVRFPSTGNWYALRVEPLGDGLALCLEHVTERKQAELEAYATAAEQAALRRWPPPWPAAPRRSALRPRRRGGLPPARRTGRRGAARRRDAGARRRVGRRGVRRGRGPGARHDRRRRPALG